MLFGSGSDKPTLIDWEFANISDPAQDVAKMVYDATTHGYEKDKVLKRVLESYAYLKGVSKDELEQHVRAFLPIIPLERSMSLVNRKPAGYEREVIRDRCFIRAIYEER
jgi:thiamine kinase-like enzyme